MCLDCHFGDFADTKFREHFGTYIAVYYYTPLLRQMVRVCSLLGYHLDLGKGGLEI